MMPMITAFSDVYHIFCFRNNLLQPDISVADLTSNLVSQILISSIQQFCCLSWTGRAHAHAHKIFENLFELSFKSACSSLLFYSQRFDLFRCLSSIFSNIFVISNRSLYLIHERKFLLFCFLCLFYIRFIRLLFNQFAPDSTH